MENKRTVLTTDIMKSFREKFESKPKNLLAVSACAKVDFDEICIQRKVVEKTSHIFTHVVDSEVKPVVNQKNTAQCWIFAGLNAMRIAFAKNFQLEEFEFSQAYLFFWEKIERCNFTLYNIASAFQRGEKINGRLMEYMMQDPTADGGQWEYFVNIVAKYGLMPQTYFETTLSSESTTRLNAILKGKICEYAKDLNSMVTSDKSNEEIENKILTCMEELYRVIAICLSVPPDTFTWEYYDKEKRFRSIGPITPLQFYEEYVKPLYDVENKVCFLNDPRPEHPYDQIYSVDFSGNMVGGRRTLYVNQKPDQLLKHVALSVENNEAVWFACEVMNCFSGKLGILDLEILDHKRLFDIDLYKLSKAERLLYGNMTPPHAMTFTGVSVDEKNEVTKLRVENSWGKDIGDKGYLIMTSDWFKEFCFQVVVDKKFVSEDVLDILKLEPKILPVWDPLISLAL